MAKEINQQIGTVDCPGCGAEIPLRVNKHGCVYFFCARVLGENEAGKPEKCLTRMNWGRTASRAMLQQAEKDGQIHVEPENDEQAATDGERESGNVEHDDTGSAPPDDGGNAVPQPQRASRVIESFFD